MRAAERRLALVQAERPQIRDGPSPPRFTPKGPNQQFVSAMKRGEWCLVPHVKARHLQEAARSMGGQSTTYRVNDLYSCFKVLEAPWVKG